MDTLGSGRNRSGRVPVTRLAATGARALSPSFFCGPPTGQPVSVAPQPSRWKKPACVEAGRQPRPTRRRPGGQDA